MPDYEVRITSEILVHVEAQPNEEVAKELAMLEFRTQGQIMCYSVEAKEILPALNYVKKPGPNVRAVLAGLSGKHGERDTGFPIPENQRRWLQELEPKG